jgi:hypothetical protein
MRVGFESSIVIGIIHPRRGGHADMYEPHVSRVRISDETYNILGKYISSGVLQEAAYNTARESGDDIPARERS